MAAQDDILEHKWIVIKHDDDIPDTNIPNDRKLFRDSTLLLLLLLYSVSWFTVGVLGNIASTQQQTRMVKSKESISKNIHKETNPTLINLTI